MTQNIVTLLVTVVALSVIFGLMAWGWRNRKRAQQELFDELPSLPADPGGIVLGPLTGVYIGSTVAGDWQTRIARPPLGHRSAGTLTAHTTGLRLELVDTDVWIPRADLVDVRRASVLANKAFPGDALLVARWRVAAGDGHTVLDTGFRADDKDDYPRWAELRGDAAPTQSPDTPTGPETPHSTREENQ